MAVWESGHWRADSYLQWYNYPAHKLSWTQLLWAPLPQYKFNMNLLTLERTVFHNWFDSSKTEFNRKAMSNSVLGLKSGILGFIFGSVDTLSDTDCYIT